MPAASAGTARRRRPARSVGSRSARSAAASQQCHATVKNVSPYCHSCSKDYLYNYHDYDLYYDDESARVAWIVYWSVLGGGIPVIAFGGNYIRWKIYERWMLQSGTKKRGKKSKKEKEQDAEHDKMQEGSYIQMT